jgi:hypothetical protein
MEFKFKPTVDQSGMCDGTLGYVACHAKLPKQRTRVYSFGTNANGSLVFQPASPEDHRQMSFEENEEG